MIIQEHGCTSYIYGVVVHDIDLSDHHLLTLGVSSGRKPAVYKTITKRICGNFDDLTFADRLSVFSLHCNSSLWFSLDINQLADLYDSELSGIMNAIAPVRSIRVNERSSDVWFDADCRQAKSDLRRVERAMNNASNRSTGLVEQWRALRREYRQLVRQRRCGYWRHKIEAELDNPRKM